MKIELKNMHTRFVATALTLLTAFTPALTLAAPKKQPNVTAPAPVGPQKGGEIHWVFVEVENGQPLIALCDLSNKQGLARVEHTPILDLFMTAGNFTKYSGYASDGQYTLMATNGVIVDAKVNSKPMTNMAEVMSLANNGLTLQESCERAVQAVQDAVLRYHIADLKKGTFKFGLENYTLVYDKQPSEQLLSRFFAPVSAPPAP